MTVLLLRHLFRSLAGRSKKKGTSDLRRVQDSGLYLERGLEAARAEFRRSECTGTVLLPNREPPLSLYCSPSQRVYSFPFFILCASRKNTAIVPFTPSS